MSTMDGADFKDIKNLNWAGSGCPVIEVTVISSYKMVKYDAMWKVVNLRSKGKEVMVEPTVEVEEEEMEGFEFAKFLIFKINLYICAFYTPKEGWYEFDSNYPDIIVEGAKKLKMQTEKYIGESWQSIGTKCMIDALHSISEIKIVLNPHKAKELKNASQVFFYPF